MTGDWKRAGVFLQNLMVKIYPAFELQINSDGKMILDTLRSHIDNQDLPWIPLSDKTIEFKGGDETIYVETGALRDGLVVRRIKSSVKGSTFFIGASPWKKHPSGISMNSLMIWLEYGTDKIPPRPLIQPTYEEIKDVVEKNWKNCLEDLMKG